MKIYPITVKKTTVVAASGANVNWDEDFTLSDPQMVIQEFGDPEKYSLGDSPLNVVELAPEVFTLADGTLVVSGIQAWAEDEELSDFSQAALTSYPDEGDTWVDQASTGANHGTSTTLLAKGASSSPGSDERRAYMFFDLTKFAGMEGDSSFSTPLVMSFFASTSNIVTPTTLTITGRSGTTQPFVETTATWTNASSALASYGTARFTTTKSIATGAAASYAFGESSTVLTNCINDGFLLLTFTTAGGISPDTVTIDSKEASSHQPSLQLNLMNG